MSHTYSQNVIHVVFDTKDRRKSISPEFQPRRMWAYVAGICKSSAFWFMPWEAWRITFISSSKFHRAWPWPRQFSQSSQIPHDGPNRGGPQIRVAAGLRIIQCKQFNGSRCRSIHTKSASASDKNGFRFGVSRLVEKTQNPRNLIRNLFLVRCRAYGAGKSLCCRSQPLQAGLTSGAPSALVEHEKVRFQQDAEQD